LLIPPRQKGKQSTGCCSSNGVQNKENIENIIVLDGNNKLGLDAEDDEEEEDRINNEYVQQDEDEDDEVSFQSLKYGAPTLCYTVVERVTV
jgi:hypothetical protein